MKTLIKKLMLSKIITYDLSLFDSDTILLTFDDGPHPEHTVEVLDLLGEYDVKALFFVVGECVQRHPYLLEKIALHGHLIGNHTYSHPRNGYPSLLAYEAELIKTQNIICDIANVKPKWFRPPRGTINFQNMLVPRKLGLRTMLWSCEGGEYGINRNYSDLEIACHLTRYIKRSDIVLLHDSSPKISSALKVVLPLLRKMELKCPVSLHGLY